MFFQEFNYARLRWKSRDEWLSAISLREQRNWRFDEEGPVKKFHIHPNSVYAQNNAYLELCNSSWDFVFQAVLGSVIFIVVFLLYSFFLVSVGVFDFFSGDVVSIEVLGKASLFLVFFCLMFAGYRWFQYFGMRTAFFTYARGRIRFNRLTRKVYLLRPDSCGGNCVFEWERLIALFCIGHNNTPKDEKMPGALALYHPPFHSDDPDGKGEDIIFVGPVLGVGEMGRVRAAGFWEYIRCYMEDGPNIDRAPDDAPDDCKVIECCLPMFLGTYCGMPSIKHYRIETDAGFCETLCHMISQITCSWPRFPKEWESDSGLGEPEDRPVQTGALMTALVYRVEGKLSREDEIELLTRWGIEDALDEAKEQESIV